jgi:hypothetical protein
MEKLLSIHERKLSAASITVTPPLEGLWSQRSDPKGLRNVTNISTLSSRERAHIHWLWLEYRADEDYNLLSTGIFWSLKPRIYCSFPVICLSLTEESVVDAPNIWLASWYNRMTHICLVFYVTKIIYTKFGQSAFSFEKWCLLGCYAVWLL